MADGSKAYLVFTLAATFAAHGEFGGHERRGTLSRPARSAILGLLAAARGIRRDDVAGFAGLDPAQFAVAVYDEGQPLRDYHTVQTVPTAAVKRPDSRPDALRRARGRENTTITLRDYRVGSLHAVAVWGVPLAPLAEALCRPVFTLYLGRKSCTLSAPPAPRIVTAVGPVAALGFAQLPDYRSRSEHGADEPRIRLIASDCDLGGGNSERRNDMPRDRAAWHFGARDEHLLLMEPR